MRYQGLELMKKLQSKANRACLLIDVNRDLGTFDEETWSFIEPVEQLVKPITKRSSTNRGATSGVFEVFGHHAHRVQN